MIRLSPLALAGALLATIVSVLAVAPTQAAERYVHYRDLNLASVEGRSAMEAPVKCCGRGVPGRL